MEITTDRLHLVRPSSPFLAIEINTEVPDRADYRDVMEQTLLDFATRNQDKSISIYTQVRFGVDFGIPAQCLLVGAARSKPLTEALLAALGKYIKGNVLRVYMQVTGEVSMEYHIESGILWRKDDELNWSDVSTAAKQDEDEDWEDDEDEDDGDDDDKDEDWDDDELHTGSLADRLQADIQCPMYADDKLTVGKLQKKIEDCFGLPRGSVRLSTKKKKFRTDALISTLRKHWEE